MNIAATSTSKTKAMTDYDVIIVGAGFAGLSKEPEREWLWSEQYFSQPELEAYAKRCGQEAGQTRSKSTLA